MQEDLKNFITKLIRDEVLGVKESIKQDMDRRNELICSKTAIEVANQIKDLIKEEIKPMQKQLNANSEEIRFAKKLGYIFAAFVVWATDMLTKFKFW